MELPSAQGHGCVQWIPPGFQCTSCRSYPLISPAHAAAGPVSCLVLPAGTPFWHMPQQAQLFLSWVIFTACTESCSPLGSSHSIRLLLPPAGEAAGCQSLGMLSLGSLAEGLGGSGTAATWHRVSRLWVLAGSGDSVPLGFLPWLLQGLCGRRAACQGQVVPGSLGHL